MGESAAGAFAPMLGVGVSSVGSVGVPGPSRGSAVPQLHGAIVERLRARIELCRRHHSTCEDRYRRGQLETSDREHESTLHLLSVVQQGPGNRKSKGSRASSLQTPDCAGPSGPRGPRGPSLGDQRVLLEDNKMSTRMVLQGSLRRKMEAHHSCQTFSSPDFKRVRLQAPCERDLGHAHSSRKPSDVTLKEMKREPVEVRSCAQVTFDLKDEGQMDPDLQDLFDELTKSVPPLDELDLEKMLKQDDTFALDLGRPGSTGLEKPIKIENSADYVQVLGGSSLRPSCSAVAQKVGAQRSMPCWPDISHAQQLKQMAANQQQPGSLLHHRHLLHHHHQSPPAPPCWTPTVTKVVSRGAPRCPFRSTKNHHLEMKPVLHFSSKAALSSGHMMADQQQLSPPPTRHFHNQQNLQNLHASTLTFKSAQQHQGGIPGPRLPANGCVGQPRPLVSNQTRPLVSNQTRPLVANQLKGSTKSSVMQRQLSQQHQQGDEDDPQEAFSRRLTRPPPDYKRSVVGGNIFPGSSHSEKEASPMSCHLPGELMSSDGIFVGHFPHKTAFPGANTPGNSSGINAVVESNRQYQHGTLAAAHKHMGMLPSVGDACSRATPTRSSPEQRVPAGSFPEVTPGAYHGGRTNHVTFDFLPEGDNMVPGINTDSDFIDSLLKSGSGNDDWMKDINLDDILGNHT
ncbi:mastermind-like protein 2 [Entelurus aequoreus]|uniref:mastermind-like protein 2 n=1 Tax=Entelurus aequoreus TaxID=161455 RepID=UPI002B1DB56E|nr:mastermind-like protein 2 [Entelurus aequoreus]